MIRTRVDVAPKWYVNAWRWDVDRGKWILWDKPIGIGRTLRGATEAFRTSIGAA